MVILCFEKRFSKQNSAIRLKSNILAQKKIVGPPQIFGLAMPLNTIDDIFVVKFGRNSSLYGHQHKRFKIFVRRCAS